MAKDKPLPQAGPELAEYTTAAQPKAYADGVPVFCAHDAIVPLKDLRPNPKNPNQHPPEQIKLLSSIIRATGWRGPITVSKRSGYIVKGHGRMMAAELGDMAEAPVDYQDYASEAEELADLTADNRIAELATTDNKLLAEVFADLDTGEIPFMLSGYTEEDYGNIVTALSEALHAEEPKGDPDAEIPPPAEPVTKYGDLWILGRHRVLCGDCTHPEDRALLLDGAKPEILLTDPPYLDDFDHWLRDDLGLVYGRYMDDFYIISSDKLQLREILKRIEEYIKPLGLRLNGKTQIFPLKNGIDFLGFHTYLTSTGKVVRKVRAKSIDNMKRKIRKFRGLVDRGKMTLESVSQSYASWTGHISHGNTYHLRQNMDAYFFAYFPELKPTERRQDSCLKPSEALPTRQKSSSAASTARRSSGSRPTKTTPATPPTASPS